MREPVGPGACVPSADAPSLAQFRRQRVVTFPAAPVEECTAGAGDLSPILFQDVPLLLLLRVIVSFGGLLILGHVLIISKPQAIEGRRRIRNEVKLATSAGGDSDA